MTHETALKKRTNDDFRIRANGKLHLRLHANRRYKEGVKRKGGDIDRAQTPPSVTVWVRCTLIQPAMLNEVPKDTNLNIVHARGVVDLSV